MPPPSRTSLRSVLLVDLHRGRSRTRLVQCGRSYVAPSAGRFAATELRPHYSIGHTRIYHHVLLHSTAPLRRTADHALALPTTL